MTDAIPISAAVPDFAAKATDMIVPSTGLTLPSPRDVLALLRALPERLNDEQLSNCARIATAPLPALPKATPEQFAACLRRMSVLPRRPDDDTKGDHRIKIFARLLGDYPLEALGFMTRVVLERCTFHPVPAECLEILKEWKRTDDGPLVKALAWSKAEAERSARFGDLCAQAATLSEAEIDALSIRTKIAMENRCLLWRLPSGRFVPRNCSWQDALAIEQDQGVTSDAA